MGIIVILILILAVGSAKSTGYAVSGKRKCRWCGGDIPSNRHVAEWHCSDRCKYQEKELRK